MFAITTNVCVTDIPRIRHTVKSWIRTFGDSLNRITITVDPVPPSGRIALLHAGSDTQAALDEELRGLMAFDSRISTQEFCLGANTSGLAKRWFKQGLPIRCQGGTPILAFIQAIDAANTDFVLRADCDMLFHEAGWLAAGVAKLRDDTVDLVEPPHLGGRGSGGVSTRALLLSPTRFYRRCLPITAHKLGWIRQIHRRIISRPPWLALEQMLTIEVRAGRVRHSVLPESSGFSLHIPTRHDASLPWFCEVVHAVEKGAIPRAQSSAGWDFAPSAWKC